MSHVCNDETLMCVHSSYRHASGLYICNTCQAKWEISWRGHILSRLTRNNVEQIGKVAGAITVSHAGKNLGEATGYQILHGTDQQGVDTCTNCKKRVAFIYLVEGSGKRLRCPSCWTVQKGK